MNERDIYYRASQLGYSVFERATGQGIGEVVRHIAYTGARPRWRVAMDYDHFYPTRREATVALLRRPVQ